MERFAGMRVNLCLDAALGRSERFPERRQPAVVDLVAECRPQVNWVLKAVDQTLMRRSGPINDTLALSSAAFTKGVKRPVDNTARQLQETTSAFHRVRTKQEDFVRRQTGPLDRFTFRNQTSILSIERQEVRVLRDTE